MKELKMKKVFAQQHGDERGQLAVLEEKKEIPFEVKRVYYIYDTLEGVHRGGHAHRSLKQLLICVHGSCKVWLDNGEDKKEVLLDKPNEGIYIEGGIWREMYDFSPNAVFLVLASELYDEAEYIRNYDEFLKFVKENKF